MILRSFNYAERRGKDARTHLSSTQRRNKGFNTLYREKFCGRNGDLYRGFTLLELLVYIAIFSIVVVFLVQIFTVIVRSRSVANARFEVNENLRFAVEKIQQSAFDASMVLVTGSCPLNVAEFRIGSATTSYQVVGDGLLATDNDGVTISASYVTSSSTIVSGIDGSTCMFTKISNPSPAKATLQTKIKVRYNDQGKPELKASDVAQITNSLR